MTHRVPDHARYQQRPTCHPRCPRIPGRPAGGPQMTVQGRRHMATERGGPAPGAQPRPNLPPDPDTHRDPRRRSHEEGPLPGRGRQHAVLRRRPQAAARTAAGAVDRRARRQRVEVPRAPGAAAVGGGRPVGRVAGPAVRRGPLLLWEAVQLQRGRVRVRLAACARGNDGRGHVYG